MRLGRRLATVHVLSCKQRGLTGTMGNCASNPRVGDVDHTKAKNAFRLKTGITMAELRICVELAIDSFAKAQLGQNGAATKIFDEYKTDLTMMVEEWDAMNKEGALEASTALSLETFRTTKMRTPVKPLFSVSLDEGTTDPVPSNVLGQAIGKSFLAYKSRAPGDKWAEAMASSTEKEWNTKSGSIGGMLRFLNTKAEKAERAVATLGEEHDEVLKAKGFQIMTKAMLEGAHGLFHLQQERLGTHTQLLVLFVCPFAPK